jgi:hypothetical protein
MLLSLSFLKNLLSADDPTMALHMLGKHSNTYLHPSPVVNVLKVVSLKKPVFI